MNSSAKRILQILTVPVFILLMLSILLYLQQRGYQSSGSVGIEENFIDQDRWEAIIGQSNQDRNWESDRHTLILWDANDEDSVQTYTQIDFVLKTMGVTVTSRQMIIPTEKAQRKPQAIRSMLPSGCTDVIICFSALISSGIDTADLSMWVRDGGKLIIASGLETDEVADVLYPDQDWQSLLGIKSVHSEMNVLADSMLMLTSILAGAKGMEFSDDVIQCEVVDAELQQECIVHIETADDYHRPLLWERDYGAGRVLVCNADLMDGKPNRGMIASCFAFMDSALAYPVINASVYCIDDFPSAAPAGFDTNVLTQYGYTVEDFYINVWWPAMQKIAERYGIRYSAFLIQCYEADVQGPFTNVDHQPSAAYFSKLLLETGSELGLHGYNHQPLVLEGYTFDEKNSGYTYWITVESMLDSIKAALAYASSLSQDVNIQAYVAPSNVLGSEAMNAMIRQFEDIRIYAGVYIGTPDQLVQEFSVLEDDVVLVPRLTADMQMESSEWWLQVNELNYHFYESNYIHPDDILDEERSDGGDFTAMTAAYENMVQWNQRYGLKTATISEAAGSVQRYCNLSLAQTNDENGITIHLDGLIDEAYLLLRTRKTPASISAGEMTMIDEGCYLIKTEAPDLRVEWRE